MVRVMGPAEPSQPIRWKRWEPPRTPFGPEPGTTPSNLSIDRPSVNPANFAIAMGDPATPCKDITWAAPEKRQASLLL